MIGHSLVGSRGWQCRGIVALASGGLLAGAALTADAGPAFASPAYLSL